MTSSNERRATGVSAVFGAARRYDLDDVDQLEVAPPPDLVPHDPGSRHSYARMLAMDATIYGLASVYEYVQLYDQAVDTTSAVYTGFNAFQHERQLATPEFAAFKTPNVDTLYSNAWLDLSAGPVIVDIPPIAGRYYTLQFVDMYGNATNLSSRTVGEAGGHYCVMTTTWDGDVPAGTTPFRVATPYMWILMRILVNGPGADVDLVTTLQDAVTLTPVSGAPRSADPSSFVATSFADVQTDAIAFFTALDWTLRHNGFPVEESAYVHRFRSIGVGGTEPFDPVGRDAASVASIQDGFRDAMEIISTSRGQIGTRGVTGWNTGSAGEFGLSYLRRAVQNFVGTGGNIEAEKKFFVTFEDGEGRTLDGSAGRYLLKLTTPPPVDGYWSFTVYPQSTGLLYPNELDRYAISSVSELMADADGSTTIVMQHRRPDEPANWLPVPAEPFYVDLRTWEPRAETRDGRWLPPRIERAD